MGFYYVQVSNTFLNGFKTWAYAHPHPPTNPHLLSTKPRASCVFISKPVCHRGRTAALILQFILRQSLLKVPKLSLNPLGNPGRPRTLDSTSSSWVAAIIDQHGQAWLHLCKSVFCEQTHGMSPKPCPRENCEMKAELGLWVRLLCFPVLLINLGSSCLLRSVFDFLMVLLSGQMLRKTVHPGVGWGEQFAKFAKSVPREGYSATKSFPFQPVHPRVGSKRTLGWGAWERAKASPPCPLRAEVL